jgi:hypothetical protein
MSFLDTQLGSGIVAFIFAGICIWLGIICARKFAYTDKRFSPPRKFYTTKDIAGWSLIFMVIFVSLYFFFFDR